MPKYAASDNRLASTTASYGRSRAPGGGGGSICLGRCHSAASATPPDIGWKAGPRSRGRCAVPRRHCRLPQTLGVELVDGRLPDERDSRDAPLIVVINETFARLVWPGRLRSGPPCDSGEDAPWRTVVGVVRTSASADQTGDKPGAYVTYAQVLTSGFPESLVVRTRTSGRPTLPCWFVV